MAHRKSNKVVEGDPDSGHSGGLPLRPDGSELAERTDEDREDVGLDPDGDTGDTGSGSGADAHGDGGAAADGDGDGGA